MQKVDPNDVPEGCKTAFVKNLPYEAREQDIAQVLGGKKVAEVRVVTEGANQRPKGFAYVDFRETEFLREAIVRAGSDRGITIKGRRLRVDYETGGAKAGFTYRKEAFKTKLGPLSNKERKFGKKGGE